jgi:carboxymethylenebutenolidase
MVHVSIVVTVGLAMISGQAARVAVVESTGSFVSQGKTIGVEKFEPKEGGKHPAILILHGAGGMEIGGPEFREFARELARRGYVAQIVHYFDRTGTRRADGPAIGRSFSSWMLTIGDALTEVSKQSNVDPGRIGLLGFSLGSYLSLSVASQDRRVSAVVEYFGGLPDPFTWNLKRFPPTLILHGDADPVVPVAEARKLERLFREKNLPFEIRVYAGQGHRFTGEDDKDAYLRSLAFFDKHVRGAGGG